MKEPKPMRPQDIVILLKILCTEEGWRQTDIARALFMSQSEISEALHRSAASGLIDQGRRIIQRKALLEFLVHGLKYVFPARPGPIVRGVPTAHSAAPLSDRIRSRELYVWPCAEGNERGQAIRPLYRTVPQAALQDSSLHRMLALTDSLRVGRAREISLAAEELKELLSYEKSHQH
jgi:transcriptional regulator with XRE-family HTH domain